GQCRADPRRTRRDGRRPERQAAAGPGHHRREKGRMTAYLVGGGIASLSAAVFLIRDAEIAGPDVHILEELPRLGGALDGAGDPMDGFVARGGRMLEEEA